MVAWISNSLSFLERSSRTSDMKRSLSPLLLRDFRLDLFVDLGFQIIEAEILQARFHPVDAHPAGQRCIDVQRLLGNAPLFFRGLKSQRPHVVEPVGQFDQDHADVRGHGQDHLSDVFGLPLLTAA